MKSNISDLLDKLKRNLDDDLLLSQDKADARSADKNKRSRFITYLVLIATHPVKLKSPTIPFNSSQEEMLAYLMEIFSLNDNHLRKIIISEKQQNRNKLQRKSIEYFVNRHIRLYNVCLLYQLFLFAASIRKSKLKESLMFQSISLENLLYLPAYSILNHHRLKIQLTSFEDKSLRRSAMLMILARLDQPVPNTMKAKAKKVQIMLTSVVQNEYFTSRRTIGDMKAPDSHLDLIIGLEYILLKEYVELVLIPKLKSWFQNLPEIHLVEAPDKSIMFAAMKLCKVAIKHFKRCKKTTLTLERGSINILSLKNDIEVVLCQVILEHAASRLSNAATLAAKDTKMRPKNSTESVWFDLLRELRLINHDLCLHWSRKGLDGLIIGEREHVKKLNLLTNEQTNELKSSIESMITDYLG